MFKLDGVAACGICFINSFYVKWATRMQVSDFIVKFLQDKEKYRKRRAKISADISARLFRVTCNKVSGILIHKDRIVDVKSWT